MLYNKSKNRLWNDIIIGTSKVTRTNLLKYYEKCIINVLYK